MHYELMDTRVKELLVRCNFLIYFRLLFLFLPRSFCPVSSGRFMEITFLFILEAADVIFLILEGPLL